MMTATTHLASHDTQHLKDGIRKFIRTIGLFADPLHGKWVAEEQDLIEGLETLKTTVAHTKTMVGQRKYQGVDFNPASACRKDMQVYLLTGRTEATDATERKRNQPMYYLVIEPVIDMLAHYEHTDMIDIAPDLIDEVISLVRECTDYGNEDDARIALEQLRVQLNIREVERKEAAAKRKPRKNKHEALLAALGLTDDGDDEPEPEVQELQ